MSYYKKKNSLAILAFLLSPVLSYANVSSSGENVSHSKSFSSRKSYGLIETGYYFSDQGKKQHIDIKSLIGDEFTVTDHRSGNGFIGLGYFFKALERKYVELDYGINAFYLPKTSVKGNVIQENMFTNLSYKYKISHYPIYLSVNSKINTGLPKFAINLNVGIGPNVLRTSSFTETALNDNTVPDDIFSGKTQTAFSATAGASVELYKILGPLSLDLGYRFFYLGKGQFKKVSSQVEDNLSTGNCYGNAIVFSIKI